MNKVKQLIVEVVEKTEKDSLPGRGGLGWGDFATSFFVNLFEKKSAFTLAEVLITLGVIGVVAAMTLPSVINNFQVSSWESGLKKSYATITNGFHAIASENGGDLRNSGLFDDVDSETFSNRMDEAVRKHFKVIKTYKVGESNSYKVNRIKNNGEFEFPYIAADTYTAYLNNGAIFSIFNGKCAETNFKDESNLKYSCARFIVDINGEKGPNVTGKDVLFFGSMNEKGDIYPDTSLEWAKSQVGKDNALTYKSYWRNNAGQCGTPNKKISEETVAKISGQNCLARIMENGWKMDYLR